MASLSRLGVVAGFLAVAALCLPLADLTVPWAHDHETSVGTVSFPQTDPESRESKLIALLATELGANPGNWDETAAGPAAFR